MKYMVCMNYILDVPDKELDAWKPAAKIADDVQRFIDNYAYKSYYSFVERLDDDDAERLDEGE